MKLDSKQIVLIFSMIVSTFSFAGNDILVHLKFNNIRNTKGNIVIAVYNSSETFKNDAPLMNKIIAKSAVKGSFLQVTLSLPAGTYGFAILDDENQDMKMNYSWLQIPTEGFGFSKYYHTGLFRPKFSDFSFQLSKGQNTQHTIKLKYM